MLHDLHAHRRKGVLFALGLDHNIDFPAANDTEQRLPVPAVHRVCVRAGLLGGARLPPNAPRCPAVASDRISPETPARSAAVGVGAFASVLRQRATSPPTITKTPRLSGRGNTLRVASVSTNLRGRR
jgi:hypothetical protein